MLSLLDEQCIMPNTLSFTYTHSFSLHPRWAALCAAQLWGYSILLCLSRSPSHTSLTPSHTLSLTHRDAVALDELCILMEGSVLTIHPRLQIENSKQYETVNILTLKPEAPSRDAVAARRAVHHTQRNDAVGMLDFMPKTVNSEP